MKLYFIFAIPVLSIQCTGMIQYSKRDNAYLLDDQDRSIAIIEKIKSKKGERKYVLAAHETWRYQNKTMREWRTEFSSDKELVSFFKKSSVLRILK